MNEYSALLNRRSIRRFKNEKVPDNIVQNLLKAAMTAPSAHNLKPWEFIVVKNRAKLEEMSLICQYWKMLKNADFAIAIVANLREYSLLPKEFFIQDCAASTQNILIAAQGEGIGGVWLGCYPVEENMSGLAAALCIPSDIIPFSVMAFGMPDEQKHGHTTFYEQKVHIEKY